MLLDLRGQITLGRETETLRQMLDQLIRAGRSQVILNLAEVNYIDSVGIATLIASYKSAREQGGDVKLLNLTRRVHDVLQITRLCTVFDTYDTVEKAQRSFGQKPLS
jgi:anti-sigma B factor antagonist